MTVLQKIKNDLTRFLSSEYLTRDNKRGLEIALEQIEKYFPAEEHQIRDAFEAGEYCESKKGHEEPATNFQTYIKNLKA